MVIAINMQYAHEVAIKLQRCVLEVRMDECGVVRHHIIALIIRWPREVVQSLEDKFWLDNAFRNLDIGVLYHWGDRIDHRRFNIIVDLELKSTDSNLRAASTVLS